jgi:hypothetical protein
MPPIILVELLIIPTGVDSVGHVNVTKSFVLERSLK